MARPDGVRVAAPAKINLFLHVGAKRADGFHALESLAVFAEVCDRLTFSPAKSLELRAEGPFAAKLPPMGENLVVRAARALSPERGVRIVIEKNIPVSSGLGGGSADAAAALRGLNLLWDLGKSESELMETAATLGSDVPVCVLSRPALMEGRGEIVTPVYGVPQVATVLITPEAMLPTVDVFSRVVKRTGLGQMERAPARMETIWDVTAYLAGARNDLEEPACALVPEIEDVLDALSGQPGCAFLQMSGSGPSCFGLFEGRHFALEVAESVAHEHPKWWVRATRIADANIGAPHWLK
ncbi:MAG: 4-(cytidine 5'-diphospho)-2-C-methyl-D-erythritol kinase [Alphaproteobacteria bacterium]